MELILIGNPNVGKTTLFNCLTGASGTVGNWSGVTVEKYQGVIKGTQNVLVDLPGIYSLTPSSEDQGVVTRVLMTESYGGILNVVDANHLKRNLQLTIQLLETGVPILVVISMEDELAKKGQTLQINQLEKGLGVSVVQQNKGVDFLKQPLFQLVTKASWSLEYSKVVEDGICELLILLEAVPTKLNHRWLAIQMLEGNEGVFQKLNLPNEQVFRETINQIENQIIENQEAQSLKGAIFNGRRQFITNLCKECLKPQGTIQKNKIGLIDQGLTHPIYGLLSFLVMMWLIYFITFDLVGNPLSTGFSQVLDGWIMPRLSQFLVILGLKTESIIYRVLIEGVMVGFGGVLVFLPQILILFFCLSIMEASGYMARVVIVMDPLLMRFGLDGKAVIPLIIGLGCNVPAIMSTRTITDSKERFKTMMVLPFVSCSARVPIYVLMVTLFFSQYQGLIMMGLHVLSLVIALFSAKLLTVTVFNKRSPQFVLEVPPYRRPQFKNILIQTINRGTDFFQTAGKFIILGSIVLWFLQSTGPGGVYVASDASYLAVLGSMLAPFFVPIGLGTWQVASSLVIGFLAKELVASSLLIIGSGEEGVLSLFTPASALSFLTFSLLYIPCLATVGVMYRETQSLKLTLGMIGFGFGVAYLVSLMIYHVGQVWL